MNLKTLLNREISFTKTTFYIVIITAVIIGVLSALYMSDFFNYLGLDLLADNTLLIALVITLLSSVSALTNIVFGSSKKNVSNNDLFTKQINELELASNSIKKLEEFIEQQKMILLKIN